MVQRTIKKQTSRRIGLFFQYAGCIIVAIIFVFPFVYMVLNSFAGDDTEILSMSPSLFPTHWDIKNYLIAFKNMNYLRSLGNTLLIMVPVIILNMLGSLLAAYGFARYNGKLKNFLFGILVSSMMLPWVVTMVPSFVMFKYLGWVGTRLPLIIPAFGGSAYNIFMMRQFIMSIPRDLDEAAKIDGCSEVGILFKIILPNMKPVLVTLLIFLFTSMWSDYIGPSIYLLKEDQYTLSLALLQLNSGYTARWRYTLAGSTLFAMPVAILLFCLQDYFIGNSMESAIK
ncbi:MAG: carbohydrate ABC transporter permease [Candidatus Enteromonas sp.]|nr:carbohydrate ABC transporter permease [Candidatus Enteromonas sp.]